MISMLRGKVAYQNSDSITLDVQGVGYHVFISAFDANELVLEQDITLYVATIVREDAINLYGFLQDTSKNVFDIKKVFDIKEFLDNGSIKKFLISKTINQKAF